MIHNNIENWKKGINESAIVEGKHIEPITYPEFTGTGNCILAGKPFWVVYVMASSTTGDRYKSISRDPQNMLHLVNFILGGQGMPNESIANELGGFFENEADARKFYDSLDYRAES